jgi:hypothetical protein
MKSDESKKQFESLGFIAQTPDEFASSDTLKRELKEMFDSVINPNVADDQGPAILGYDDWIYRFATTINIAHTGSPHLIEEIDNQVQFQAGIQTREQHKAWNALEAFMNTVFIRFGVVPSNEHRSFADAENEFINTIEKKFPPIVTYNDDDVEKAYKALDALVVGWDEAQKIFANKTKN